MKKKTRAILCCLFCILCTITTNAQDRRDQRAKIIDYLNHEIWIEDSFAGQSITLVREDNDYIILRKYFGSGVPVIASTKYKVVFNSDYQIEYGTEVIDSVNIEAAKNNEVFRLSVENNGLNLYLNGLKVVLNEH